MPVAGHSWSITTYKMTIQGEKFVMYLRGPSRKVRFILLLLFFMTISLELGLSCFETFPHGAKDSFLVTKSFPFGAKMFLERFRPF
jgi:hypothetical protein